MSHENAYRSTVFGIEGPAGAGKSTMANRISQEMGIPVVEGGQFYRKLTYAAMQKGITLTDTSALVELATELPTLFSKNENGNITYQGVPVDNLLRDESVSTNVSTVSQQLEVRAVIEKQILDTVLAHQTTIIVGRAVKKLLPDAYVLNLTIHPDEAERRHEGRIEGHSQSVKERNDNDAKTAQKLGVVGAHEATVDVTSMGPDEQAAVLREFITSHQS